MGLIIDGEFNIGDHIIIDQANKIEIKGIESVYEQKRRPLVGLRLGDAIISQADLDKIKGQTLTIISQ